MQATAGEIDSATEAAGSAPFVKQLNTLVYQAPCHAPEDHIQCDLEAQWKAADSARDAANWSWYQMIISMFGLAGLLYSLELTRKATGVAIAATKDADKALGIAARNADAADEQVAHAKDTARRQLRAYVFVENVLLTEEGP